VELDLKELSLTFLSGAFVLLYVEALVWYTFGMRLTGFFAGDWGWHQSSQGEHGTPTHFLVVLVFCFPTGLLMEDLCYKGADAIAFPVYRFLRLPLTTFVDELSKENGTISRFTLQTVTIAKGLHPFNHCPQGFSEKPLPVRTSSIEITGLGYELASRGAFSQIDNTRGVEVEQWIRESATGSGGRYSRFDGTLQPQYGAEGAVNLPHRCSDSSLLTREDVRDSIQRLWYNAKNRVYTNQQYYQEIERMQSRLDFSRTVAVISLLVEGLSLLFILLAEYVQIANDGGASVRLGMHWRRRSWYRSLIVFAIYLAATVAYTRESLEINKRVYGYYSSILSQESRLAAHNSTVTH
jgi:hypothetical protein